MKTFQLRGKSENYKEIGFVKQSKYIGKHIEDILQFSDQRL